MRAESHPLPQERNNLIFLGSFALASATPFWPRPQNGGKGPPKGGDSDFPSLWNPTLETAKEGHRCGGSCTRRVSRRPVTVCARPPGRFLDFASLYPPPAALRRNPSLDFTFPGVLPQERNKPCDTSSGASHHLSTSCQPVPCHCSCQAAGASPRHPHLTKNENTAEASSNAAETKNPPRAPRGARGGFFAGKAPGWGASRSGVSG